MSTPQSIIHICSGVRLDNGYRNSIYFDSKTAQESYFAGKVVKTFPAYTYLRKSWSVKVEATMEQARTWEYLFFQNGGNGKLWYYFINQIEYINDSTVELFLEMDVIQSYFFDFNLLPSFVERIHTASDEIGEHTVEEGIDVGELTVKSMTNLNPGSLCIMIMCTINPNVTSAELAVPALSYRYNDVFSGVKIWAVHPTRWAEWGNQLETLNDIGQSEAIVAMWMYPIDLVQLGGGASWTGGDIAVPVESATTERNSTLVWEAQKNLSDLDGYTPKNSKLFCYPYNFVWATNNSGSHAVYRYERFNDNKMHFAFSGSLAPDGGVHMTPKNYDGLEFNYGAGMNLTGFPTCAWNSDIYKLWLAQNQGTQGMSALTGMLKIAGGIGAVAVSGVATATGAGAIPGVAGITAGLGMIGSGIQQVGGLMAQNHDKDIVPPQANGSMSSSVNITNGMHSFTLYRKCLTNEMARIIDDYFTMYGYKVNRVMLPYLDGRPGFTFVKTIGCNLWGDFPMEDQKKIRDIFDSGITFWKRGDTIGNYSIQNAPAYG